MAHNLVMIERATLKNPKQLERFIEYVANRGLDRGLWSVTTIYLDTDDGPSYEVTVTRWARPEPIRPIEGDKTNA
jgi:hypothetical protein